MRNFNPKITQPWTITPHGIIPKEGNLEAIKHFEEPKSSVLVLARNESEI